MKWRCEQCKHWFKDKKDRIESLACVWYGDRGKPPFSKPYNDSPLVAKVCYCGGCFGKEKLL